MSGYDDFSDYQGEPLEETDGEQPSSEWPRWLLMGLFAADIGCLIWLCVAGV